MTKSKLLFDKITKAIEQGIISYKDLNSDLVNILKTKRDEIVFKMHLTTKEETEVFYFKSLYSQFRIFFKYLFFSIFFLVLYFNPFMVSYLHFFIKFFSFFIT